MKQFSQVVLVGIISLVAFWAARIIWPFPEGTDLVTKNFFTIVTAIESAFLGFGLFFILRVFTKYKQQVWKWKLLDWLTFLSISWILISGYPHDNTHIAHETSIQGLISIEVIFHGTLAIAAIFITFYFLKQQRSRA